MEKIEIFKELEMTYEDLLNYLVQKYGGANCDYFATSECKSKSKKISRTAEGLYCHHMDEDKGVNLGNPEQARMQTYEWQRKERLVYCNIIEHLILHIKIAVLRQKELFEEPRAIEKFFTSGGIFMICQEFNDMIMNDGTTVEWRKNCYKEVKDNYEDYIVLINAILKYISIDYMGDKDAAPFLVKGGKVEFADGEAKILKINKKRDKFLLQFPDRELSFSTALFFNQYKYVDHMDRATRRMASGSEVFYDKIHEDIIKCDKEADISTYAMAFKIDYNGQGFVKFQDVKLEGILGNKDADEYIAKALPMHCETVPDLTNKQVEFWKGPRIPVEAQKNFYIVRIETMFTIKEGEEPFVRYRERDLMRSKNLFGINSNHNMKDRGWTVLATSDVYDKRTEEYYDAYYDENGKLVDAKVILTLGKDDFLLFKEKHDIRRMKILDGCYFYE